MTAHGYRKLTERKAELEDLLQEAGERAGDAAGIERNWHDNAGYDQAIQEIDVLQAQLADVTAQLNTAEIIETTASSDRVVIGSQVTVEIDGESGDVLRRRRGRQRSREGDHQLPLADRRGSAGQARGRRDRGDDALGHHAAAAGPGHRRTRSIVRRSSR